LIDYNEVRAALDGRLEAYQATNIAWENSNFTPKEGVGYLRPFMLPVEPKQATVGVSGLDRVSGIYQIDVAEPKDGGNGALLRKVDAVIAQFARGLSVTSNGVTVTILRSWPGPALARGSFYVIPVSVSWYTYG